MKRHFVLSVAVLVLALGLSPVVRAQDAQDTPDQAAPADNADQNPQSQPAVAHISFIHGDVSVQRGDSGDWIAATLNTPLEAGDRISTGEGSRAEVQFDYANIIRLDQNSTVKITNFTRSQIQVQVGEGLVNYAVLPNNQADAEIDTPNSAVHPLRQGEYRIAIASDSQTDITVRDGQAEVSEPQGTTRVDAGQFITIQGTDNPQYQTSNAAGPDDFDRWCDSRDHTISTAQSWQHTDRYYTGSQDLDAYGHWENVPDYGQVWVPSQDSGWAPYRDGTWDWEPYYGWTWVSYEPWGWAPYHYGRWFVYGGNWAWWPGPVGVYGGWNYYPVWSPAYVSFFGWGSGVSFGFGFGNFGWLPCGPGDFFTPWWGFGVTQVTIVNVININRFDNDDRFGHDRFGRGVGDRDFGRRMDPLFRGKNGFSNIGRFNNDARIRLGVTSVRGDQFGHGGGKFERGMTSAQFHQAQFMTGRLPAVPNHQSLGRVQEHVLPGIARTTSANNQHFFSQSRASFTQRSFSQEASAQQRMIENSRGQNGADNARFSQSGAAKQDFHTNGGAGNQQHGNSANEQARPGWHTFGENGGAHTQQGQANTPNHTSMQQPSHGSQNGTSPHGGNSSGTNDAWHRFTPPSSNNGARQQQQMPSRTENNGMRPQETPRQNQSHPNTSSGNGNWHQFTPPSQQSRPSPRSNSGRGESAWGGASRGNYGNYSSRQQLDMRQPVVNQRSYGGYYGRSNGGGYSAPRGGSYSRPSGGFGGYSPRSSGGGSYGRPSGGSGGYRGGGGGSHTSSGGSHGSASHGGGRPH